MKGFYFNITVKLRLATIFFFFWFGENGEIIIIRIITILCMIFTNIEFQNFLAMWDGAIMLRKKMMFVGLENL